MENKIAQALATAKKDPDFIDLIQTNFTVIGKGLGPKVLTELARTYFANRTYNPDSLGLLKTRDAIAGIYDNEIKPEKVIVTASTSESYSLLFNNLTQPGDEILLPTPGYPLFEYLCKYSHINPKFYQLDYHNNWQPDLASITAQISTKTKGIVLISPNNPTGAIINPQNLAKIVEVAKLHGLFIIFDEVFNDFVYPSAKFVRPKIDNANVPIFFLNGISKMLAMPDLKLAWIACNNRVLNESLEDLEIANDTYLNANYLSQDMFPELLKHKDTAQVEIKTVLNTNWQTLNSITTISEKQIECVLPAGGIHAVISLNILERDEEKICLELLTKCKVAVHPGYFYELQSAKPSFVISLLQTPEKFSKALSILLSFVIQYASSK